MLAGKSPENRLAFVQRSWDQTSRDRFFCVLNSVFQNQNMFSEVLSAEQDCGVDKSKRCRHKFIHQKRLRRLNQCADPCVQGPVCRGTTAQQHGTLSILKRLATTTAFQHVYESDRLSTTPEQVVHFFDINAMVVGHNGRPGRWRR